MKNRVLFVMLVLLIPLIVYAAGRTRFWGQVLTPLSTTLAPSGTTETVDFDQSNIHTLDLGSASGDVTLTLSNAQAGAVYIIKIIQGGTARLITWPAEVLWSGGEAITLSTTEDAVDIVSCLYDGTSFYCNGVNDYQ